MKTASTRRLDRVRLLCRWLVLTGTMASSLIMVDESSAAASTMKDVSGVYIGSDAADAVSFKTYFNEAVAASLKLKPELTEYRVDPKPLLRLDHLGVAVPTMQHGGWQIESRPNFVWEEDPKGAYGVFVYLRNEASLRLAGELNNRKAPAMLVIDGIGWGMLELVDVKAGKWGLRHVRTYFSPWMALKLNTHIIIGWRTSGEVPNADDPLRIKLESSIREWFAFRGPKMGPIDDAMGKDGFVRMGPPGFQLLTEALDGMDIHAAWCLDIMANNLPRDAVIPLMEHIALHSKVAQIQRIAMMHIRPRTSPTGSFKITVGPSFDALLGHADPTVAAIAFLQASGEQIEGNRANVITQLRRYLAIKDHREFAENAKQDSITVSSTNMAAAQVTLQVIERIGTVRLTELADAVTETRIGAKDEPPFMNPWVRTLEQLGAVEQLGRLVLERPDLPEDELTKALQALAADGSSTSGQALVKLSDAALAGKWQGSERARHRLIWAMVRFCGLGIRDPVPPDNDSRHAVRRALTKWVNQPEGPTVIQRLAGAALPAEKDIYVAGLKSSDLQSTAACILALEMITEKSAVSALLSVLNRKDVLQDIHARGRDEQGRAARPIPIVSRSNLGYLADRAMTQITGQNVENIPDYTNMEVLKTRRDYWIRWLQQHSLPESL